MAPPIDPADPAARRTLSRGPCCLYVAPCAYEDLLKLGFSREPLARLQALHPRWFEVFDLDRTLVLETDTVREARALELRLRRQLVLHNAPAPLIVRRAAGGHSEWYRGAYDALSGALRDLQALGHPLHAPARPYLRRALLARGELLYSWTQAMLTPEDLERPLASSPPQRAVLDALDACAALGIALEPWLPEPVLHWYRAVAAR